MLDNLVPSIQKTADLVQEISAASNEQNSGAEQINKAIQQLDQIIQQNVGASDSMASTAEELSSQAEQLEQTISFFKLAQTKGHRGKQSDYIKTGFKKQVGKSLQRIRKTKPDQDNTDMDDRQTGFHSNDTDFEEY